MFSQVYKSLVEQTLLLFQTFYELCSTEVRLPREVEGMIALFGPDAMLGKFSKKHLVSFRLMTLPLPRSWAKIAMCCPHSWMCIVNGRLTPIDFDSCCSDSLIPVQDVQKLGLRITELQTDQNNKSVQGVGEGARQLA